MKECQEYIKSLQANTSNLNKYIADFDNENSFHYLLTIILFILNGNDAIFF